MSWTATAAAHQKKVQRHDGEQDGRSQPGRTTISMSLFKFASIHKNAASLSMGPRFTKQIAGGFTFPWRAISARNSAKFWRILGPGLGVLDPLCSSGAVLALTSATNFASTLTILTSC
jgi:hypothetical protein